MMVFGTVVMLMGTIVPMRYGEVREMSGGIWGIDGTFTSPTLTNNPTRSRRNTKTDTGKQLRRDSKLEPTRPPTESDTSTSSTETPTKTFAEEPTLTHDGNLHSHSTISYINMRIG